MAYTKRTTAAAATDDSMALELRRPGSETQGAAIELIAPVAGEVINSLDPEIFEGPAGVAVDAKLAAEDVIVGDDPRATKEGVQEGWRVRDRAGQTALGVKPNGDVAVGKVLFKSLPDLSPYSFVIRDMAGQVALAVLPDGTLASGGTSMTSELHAFIGGGQSNMSGRGTPYGEEFDPIDKRILQYGSRLNSGGLITDATVPLDMHDAASGLSPLTVFAREYLRTQPANVSVLLIPAAHGGTAFYTSSEVPLPPGYVTPNAGGGTWQYDRVEPVNLYKLMLAQTQAALAAAAAQTGMTPKLKGFLWHQGEGDAGRTDQAGYAAHFDALVADFRTQLAAPNLPVVVGGMSPDWVGADSARLAIRAAHVQTPARLTRAAFAHAEPDTGKYQDEIHLAREGVEKLGSAMVSAYRRALANTPSSPPLPPRNTAATFVGGVLRVQWDYPLCRATGFIVQYSIDGGAWTTAPRALTMDNRETVAGLTGAKAQVRVSTVNDVGTSTPSTITTALGA